MLSELSAPLLNFEDDVTQIPAVKKQTVQISLYRNRTKAIRSDLVSEKVLSGIKYHNIVVRASQPYYYFCNNVLHNKESHLHLHHSQEGLSMKNHLGYTAAPTQDSQPRGFDISTWLTVVGHRHSNAIDVKLIFWLVSNRVCLCYVSVSQSQNKLLTIALSSKKI